MTEDHFFDNVTSGPITGKLETGEFDGYGGYKTTCDSFHLVAGA